MPKKTAPPAGIGWPANRLPTKANIECMYRCAYYLDNQFLKPTDVVDFGIDLYQLKEHGAVKMKKGLPHLRKRAKGLWKRLSRDQRTLFLLHYFAEDLHRTEQSLSALGDVVGGVTDERDKLDTVRTLLYAKIPATLAARLEDGLGKEWSR